MSGEREKLLGLARNDEERLFVARCLDFLRAATTQGRTVLTGFLDPGEAGLLEQVCRGYGGARLSTWGGYPEAERRRALLVPAGGTWYDEDYRVEILHVLPRRPEGPPGHRDYLGSLLGLGLERDRLGDIVPQGEGAAVFLAGEIAPFVLQNLQRVGRHPVAVRRMSSDQFTYLPPRWEERVVTAASPRLDAMVSRAFNLSRSASAGLVVQGRVFLNWRQQLNPAAPVGEGDTVSCRGYGRFRVLGYAGTSKKGRERFILGFPASALETEEDG